MTKKIKKEIEPGKVYLWVLGCKVSFDFEASCLRPRIREHNGFWNLGDGSEVISMIGKQEAFALGINLKPGELAAYEISLIKKIKNPMFTKV